MNTETGHIYSTSPEIDAARVRGEPLVMVSETVVKTMRAGQRAQAKAMAKRKRKQARQSRKQNRSR
jgi:hypothetical protein